MSTVHWKSGEPWTTEPNWETARLKYPPIRWISIPSPTQRKTIALQAALKAAARDEQKQRTLAQWDAYLDRNIPRIDRNQIVLLNTFENKFIRRVLINPGRKEQKGIAKSNKFIRNIFTFLKEANILYWLNTQNARVPQLYAVCFDFSYYLCGRVILLMQDCGQPIHEGLFEQSYLERLTLAAQVIQAVKSVNQASIVHRDLKGDNLTRDHQGVVHVIDFELAHRLPSSTAIEMIDVKPVGNCLYQSPEVMNEKPFGVSADVFSTTGIIYYIMTKREPTGGFTTRDAFQKWRREGTSPSKPWYTSLIHPYDVMTHELKQLIFAGWNEEPYRRPSLQMFLQQLQIDSCLFKKNISPHINTPIAEYVSQQILQKVLSEELFSQ